MSLHDSSDDDIFDNSNSAKNVKIVSTKACKVIRKKDTGSAKKGINKCTNNEQDKCVVCKGAYSSSTIDWLNCFMCKMWAHENCGLKGFKHFFCNICN